MNLEGICASVKPIPRVPAASLSTDQFQTEYFLPAKPVIITGATDAWPARKWTLEGLVDRVGDNEVYIRGKTDLEDYRLGKAYSIRKDTFRDYVTDLLKENTRAKSSYLAVASMQQTFPQLLDEVPLPEYLTTNGKLHLGPYLWVALKGHYEFCHYDPDDNFLAMIQGRKQVRLFGHDLKSMYPNPLGSHGKTIQSNVNCDKPDLKAHPEFANANCEWCILEPGEMLFIPAFYWHQVSALDSGISLNMFYGDGGENVFAEKMLRAPYREHFEWWLLNVVEQNRTCESFLKRGLPRLREVIWHFFVKQWHDVPSEEQITKVAEIIMRHLGIAKLPERSVDEKSKFPPVLKIRGLLFRDGKHGTKPKWEKPLSEDLKVV